MNYVGGKYRLLPQILPLFPNDIHCFMDIFCGGCDVGINVNAKSIVLNDNLIYLMDLYKHIQAQPLESTLNYIEDKINTLQLSKINQGGYLILREQYNQSKRPLDLFILSAYSFSHQIRFNNSHQFNTPFGKNRSSFNNQMKNNLIAFINALQNKNITIECHSFEQLNYDKLTTHDLVYCDPPYLITTGTYNDGKRGFKGWGVQEEHQLLNLLDSLHQRNIRFALSNVIEHKGKENVILKEWLLDNRYHVHNLSFHYANSFYQNKDRNKNGSCEVLITNYHVESGK